MADARQLLLEKFRQAGCPNPEDWAASEIDENIAQFARFVFLRQLWKLVAPADSRAWLRRLLLPNDDGQGGVLRRLRSSNASIDDLTQLVRAAQIDVVRNVALLLDGFSADGAELEVQWGLFELNEDDRPDREMGGLHESVDHEDVQPPARR